MEAGIRLRHAPKTLYQQTCGNRQNNSHGDLRGNEHAAQTHAGNSRGALATRFDKASNIQFGSAESWNHSRDETGKNREQHHKEENGQVNPGLRQAWCVGGKNRFQNLESTKSKKQPNDGTSEGQSNTFGQELTDKAAAGSPESRTKTDLLAARC